MLEDVPTPATDVLFDRVVVGLAEDARSDAAVRTGLDLARALGARIEVVHAVATYSVGWSELDKLPRAAFNAGSITSAWNERLGHLRRDVGGEGPAWEGILRVLSGHPTAVLACEASHGGSPLLVIGPQRRERFDFGGTTRALLSQPPGPVWIQPDERREIRRVLAATDFSAASLPALSLAGALAARLGAGLTVVHGFVDPTRELAGRAPGEVPGLHTVASHAIEHARRRLGELDPELCGAVELESLLIEGDPGEAILGLQDSSDLIVLGTQGHTFFSRAVLGGTAYAVLRGARVPVLAVPPPVTIRGGELGPRTDRMSTS